MNPFIKKDYQPNLRCIAQQETTTILMEVHEWHAACHEGVSSIVQNILNIGYYYLTMNPTMNQEEVDMILKFE